jgi:hypothetical protein
MKKETYNQAPDPFLKQIKDKLEHHSMPVDDHLWESIEKHIQPSKPLIPAWLYVSVAVAAGLALLISVGNFFYFQTNETNLIEKTAQLHIESEQVDKIVEPITQVEINSSEQTLIVSKETAAKAQNSTKQTAKNDLYADNAQGADTKDEVASAVGSEPTKPIAATIEVIEKEADTQITQPEVVAEKPARQDKSPKLTTLPSQTHPDWTQSIHKKKKKNLMIAASFGSGVGSSSATITPRSRAYRSQGLVDVATTVGRVLTPNDFRNKEYLPPLSTELNLRMPISKVFSLESGLVYNYLQTRLSGSPLGVDNRAAIDLHYLGVPANFVASLLQTNHWEIYISAGGMIEKGLRTDFRQYQQVEDVQVKSVASTEVNGLQWSLNGTVGVGYAIHKHVSLFFDPKLAYYFESEQPYSIRKELPVLVSLNAGLRMSL